MESSNSNQIKQQFKSFSNEKGFRYHDTDSLIAPENSKLLFNISGGVKYQEEILGKKEATEVKVASIQECVRTDGMKTIGYSGRHHLFFEMLGHFMFYALPEKETKEEFIKFAYDFLVKEVGLNEDRIFATVHPEDQVTLDIWKKLGNKNIIISDSNYFVSPYADKSSLRTEIKWQNDNELVELWNLVFTEFNSKNLFVNPSEKIAADSGASLDRIVTAYENKCNDFENSMWSNYVNYLMSLGNNGKIEEYRRLADFFNTSARMINAGIKPGNKVQPYTLRKILRMMFNICETLDLNYEDFIDVYFKYNRLSIKEEVFTRVLEEEFDRYTKAIKKGLLEAKKYIKKNGSENITLEYLSSTYGLPEEYAGKIISGKMPILSKRMSKKD